MNSNKFQKIPVLERTTYASKEAGIFDVYATRWVLSYTKPKGLLIPDLNEWPVGQREALLRTLAELATKHQPETIRANISNLKVFASHFSGLGNFRESGIDVENLLSWFSSRRNEETKSSFRRLIVNTADLGYGDVFEEGVLSLAKQHTESRIRLHPERFEASRSFTESERKQLYYQLARECHVGNIALTLRVVASLALVTGKRPVQISSTKFKDFSLEQISLAEGDKRHVILYNVPVAKQKGQVFRSKFNQTPIVSSFEIWEDLERLREKYTRILNQLFNVELTDEQTLLLPIVMPSAESELTDRFNDVKNGDLGLNEFLESNRLHVSSDTVSKIISNLSNQLIIFSDFTGHPLTINAKRFRHTRATNLALSGASIGEIADALDHMDHRSASAYVDNLPARAVKIGYQVEETLGVLAKKFAGIIATDANKVIKLYTKHGTHNVGTCGMESFCTDNYPIACYECELFCPNPFGNHAAVQEYVEIKIQEAKEIGDSRLIENWHTIILAVLERRYIADQQRLNILNEAPETLEVKKEGNSNE